MEERRQPSFDPEAAARAIADGNLPGLHTPVIDVQDLEHQSWPDARIGRGARADPRQMDELIRRESGVVNEAEDASAVSPEIARRDSGFAKEPEDAPTVAVEVARGESGFAKASEDARTVGAEIAQHFKKLPKGREIF